MPNNFLPSGYCLHINSCRNRSRTHEDTSNQSRAFPHTSQNTHRSNIDISNAIASPLPSTKNTKQFLTIRLLPPHQFLQKSLENSHRHIQSSASLPSHLLKYTSIKHHHHHFGCDYGAAAIHRQRQTIPYHQAIASTSILAKIARELTQTHPIKRKPSLTPPKTHINQTSPSNIAISKPIAALLPSTYNAKQFLTIRLLPPHQLLQKLFENLQRYSNQAGAFPHTS